MTDHTSRALEAYAQRRDQWGQDHQQMVARLYEQIENTLDKLAEKDYPNGSVEERYEGGEAVFWNLNIWNRYLCSDGHLYTRDKYSGYYEGKQYAMIQTAPSDLTPCNYLPELILKVIELGNNPTEQNSKILNW